MDMRPTQWKNTAIEKGLSIFGIKTKQCTGTITMSIMPPLDSTFSDMSVTIKDSLGNIVGTIREQAVSIVKEYEDKIQAQYVDGRVDFSIDADSGYQISVDSEAPATIAVSQENAAYNSVNNGAVYTAQPGNTTIDITPDTPAAETPVTGGNGKAIEPDKVWNLGDVNGDRSANIADAVLLQKWLLNKPDSDLTEWTAADIYEDGKLNLYDLTLLKQLITE
ncbi:MAG TPA: dockerin type I repeat-containing protein [Ruminococcus sp.]|nr:dockerin type I repeat-containing protein [Ruminococcus sp.]